MRASLLLLAKYSRRGASSRLRLYQYIPSLEASGYAIHSAPLFDDRYLDALYSGKRPNLYHVFGRYLSRMRELLSLDRRIPLLIEGELFPWLPHFVERFFLFGRTYTLDYDDAIFHRYDLNRLSLVRVLLGHKIDRLMECADLVVVGNTYLASRARLAGASVIEILPTVVDIDRYKLAAFQTTETPFRIGWIGTPITWEAYGRSLFDTLRREFHGTSVEFLAIGATGTEQQSGNVHFLPWSEDTEAQLLSTLSVGLMPLEDTPWARGKCAYKLIQYLACGVPVIASPVGANCEVVKHGENGFLAATSEEWTACIALLIADREKARHMGQQGRRMVADAYSVQSAGPRLAAMIQPMTSRG